MIACVVSADEGGVSVSMPADMPSVFYAELAAYVLHYAAARGASLEDVLKRARAMKAADSSTLVPEPFVVTGGCG